MSNLVVNESYQVMVVEDPKTEDGICYGVINLETDVCELFTISLVYANIYAVETDKQLRKQVWLSDYAEDLGEIAAVKAGKDSKGYN